MRFLTKVAVGVGAVFLIKGLDSRLEICDYEVGSPDLPASFDGFRIAHISDLHSEVPDGIYDEIEKLSPDIVVISGDLIHDDNRSFDAVLELLEKLSKLFPVYIVSGNHDLWNTAFSEFLEKAKAFGVTFLDDSCAIIKKGEEEIALFGIADPFGKASEVITAGLEKSFSALPAYDGYKILLFHRANLFPRLKGKGFNLILSGHMHGGQMRIRGLGGLFPPKTNIVNSEALIFPKYTEGVYKDDKTTMIVNRGIGNPMIIPRLYNRPEIGIITLRT